MSKVADDLRRWAVASEEYDSWATGKACDGLGIKKWSKKSERELFRMLADRIEAEQREIIESQQSGGYYSAHYIMRVYGNSNGKPFKDSESITKWLDRYYIPRPCFEDGEPAECPCEIEWNGETKTMTGYRIVSSGTYELCLGANTVHMHFNDKLKRPSKVLDADGVEINVGDTVYWVDDLNEKYIVERIVFINGGGVRVFGEDRGWMPPEDLTHREHDSLTKLRDDVASTLDESAAIFPCSRDAIEEIRDRLTALIERGA